MADRYILTLDFGGAELKHVLFTLHNGQIVHEHPNPRGPFYRPDPAKSRCVLDDHLRDVPKNDRVSKYLAAETKRILQHWGVARSRIAGIGISVAGRVLGSGQGRRVATFIGAQTPPAFTAAGPYGQRYVNTTGGLLKQFPRIPILIGNDCNCTGDMQSLAYEALGTDPAATFFITIGQGFGGGGPKRDVDEVGHIKVFGVHPAMRLRCGCGDWNCVEAFASGTGFPKFARRLLSLYRNRPATLAEVTRYERLGGRLTADQDLKTMIRVSPLLAARPLDAIAIFACAKPGRKSADPFARYLVKTAADMTGHVLASVANVHGVHVFGLGGGVARNNPWYVAMIQTAANRLIGKANKLMPGGITVERSPLGASANDYGPASLVLSRHFHGYVPAWVKTMRRLAKKTAKPKTPRRKTQQ